MDISTHNRAVMQMSSVTSSGITRSIDSSLRTVLHLTSVSKWSHVSPTSIPTPGQGQISSSNTTHFLCPTFMGGFGNTLFQFASTFGIARSKNMSVVVGINTENIDAPNTYHRLLSWFGTSISIKKTKEALLYGPIFSMITPFIGTYANILVIQLIEVNTELRQGSWLQCTPHFVAQLKAWSRSIVWAIFGEYHVPCTLKKSDLYYIFLTQM
jgi:hypothetical protein